MAKGRDSKKGGKRKTRKIENIDPALRKVYLDFLTKVPSREEIEQLDTEGFYRIKTEYFTLDGTPIKNRQEGRRLFQKNLAKRKVNLIATQDIPLLDVREGEILTPHKFALLKEYITTHKAAKTIEAKYGIDYQRAFETVLEAKILYEAGILDAEDVHEILSP